MRDLAAIESVYNEIDAVFERSRADAQNAGDNGAVKKVEDKQRFNDQAYFILCWGQLETAIDEKCRDVIRMGRQHSHWTVRRAWELYNPDDKRLSGLSFEDRAVLVIEPGEPRKITIQYYNLRNQIAHGRLQANRIDVSKVIADLYVIQGSLR